VADRRVPEDNNPKSEQRVRGLCEPTIPGVNPEADRADLKGKAGWVRDPD